MAHVPITMPTLSTAAPSQPASFPGRRSPMICPLAKLGRTSPSMNHTRYHRSPSVDVGYRRSPLDPSVYSHSRATPSPLELSSVYVQQFPSRITDSLSYRNLPSPLKEENHKNFNFSNFPKTANDCYHLTTSNIVEKNFNPATPLTETHLNNRRSPFRPPLILKETCNSYQKNLSPKTNDSNIQNDNFLYQHCFNQSLDPSRCSPGLRRTSPSTEHPYLYQTTNLEASFKTGRTSPSLDQGYHTLVSPSPGPSTPSPWTEYNPLTPNAISGKGKKFSNRGSLLSPFDKLPDEVIVKIFSWLDSSDLCVCARVCKRWECLAWEPQLWRVIKLSGENLCGDKAVRCVLRRLCGQGTTGACPTVEKVLLDDGAKITDKGLTQLSRRCTELTHLQLHGCSSVTNNSIYELAIKCTNLQHLDLTGCSRISCLSGASSLEFPSRLLLQYLDLTDCSAVDDEGLKIIVRNCPQLVYLYLRRCAQITDTGVKFIPSFCSTLRELSVSDCNKITDFGLHELAKLGATLRYLSVAKCDRVSDAGLKMIARRCYKLRYLNARGCEAVSDDAITVLARSCPRLRALDIGKCDVSDAGLRALAESCPNLKKLSLRNCDLVTDRGVQCIAYYCRGLQQLNIQDCQISIDGYRAVKKYCKRCVIEHTNPGFF